MREGVPINGRVLTELRHLAGMEQIDLANAACVHTPGCKVAPKKISDYEREVVKPSAANLNAILKAIKIALEARGLELTPAMLRALYRTDTLNASNGSTGKDDEADRRHAGKTLLVGGLAAAAFPLDALERITHHGDRPIDSKLITAHEDLADTLASLHRTTRPDELLGHTAEHADRVLKLLDRPMGTEDRRRLDIIAAGACAQAGVLAFCLKARAVQRHYFALSRVIADDSGDDTLRAQTLAVARIQYSPIEAGGHGSGSGRAVTLMRQAVHHARRADPGIRADTQHWLGLELAAAGDERGFFESVEAAVRLLEHAQSHGHGFFARYLAMTPDEASRTRGFGLVRVGRAAEALDVLQVMPDPVRVRSTVIALIDIAAAHVLQGDPEQTCTDLHKALDLIPDAGYAIGIQRMLGVRARFPKPWAGLACVVELDERLRLTSP